MDGSSGKCEYYFLKNFQVIFKSVSFSIPISNVWKSKYLHIVINSWYGQSFLFKSYSYHMPIGILLWF